MTPEQWRRVGELFHEALAIPPEERAAWAERTCTTDADVHREVLSLLENDRAIIDGFVERKVKSAVVSFYEGGTASVEAQRVGPYKLLHELGRGGMGTVFLAERDDAEYHTKVAIKLVRPGMDTDIILHRFRRERQILASLEHPNIARLLDGGTTDDGRPYIVMEYIEGARITDHCQTRDLGVSGTADAVSGRLLGGGVRAPALHRAPRLEARQHSGHRESGLVKAPGFRHLQNAAYRCPGAR